MTVSLTCCPACEVSWNAPPMAEDGGAGVVLFVMATNAPNTSAKTAPAPMSNGLETPGPFPAVLSPRLPALPLLLTVPLAMSPSLCFLFLSPVYRRLCSLGSKSVDEDDAPAAAKIDFARIRKVFEGPARLEVAPRDPRDRQFGRRAGGERFLELRHNDFRRLVLPGNDNLEIQQRHLAFVFEID